MRKLIAFILSMVIVLSFTACDGKKDTSSEKNVEKYSVYLDIEFEQNLILAIYDVEVYLDDTRVGLIPHGEHYTNLIEDVEEGTHRLHFYKEGDRSISQSINLKVTEDCTFITTVHSNRSTIELKGTSTISGIVGNALEMPNVTGKVLEEALNELKQIGFTNIHYTDDVWVTSNWTVIAQNIQEKEVIDKNTRIELTCNKLGEENINTDSESKDTKKETSNLNISEEVKRSAVVFWTNNTAWDVYTDDGDAFDPSKFHAYSELTGNTIDYLIYVDSWGKWSTLEANKKWRVENIQLRKHDAYNNILRNNLTIEIEAVTDGYYISYANYYYEKDKTKYGNLELCDELRFIPRSYVIDDRDETLLDSLDKTDDITETQALTIFRKYGETVYPYGFKYHTLSADNISEQYADGSWFMQREVTIENQYGNKSDVIVSLYINNTTQQIENFTVK